MMRAGRAELDARDVRRRHELVGHADRVTDEVTPDGAGQPVGERPSHAA